MPTEPEAVWFVRVALGLGPRASSEQTELLELEGYEGAKLWVALDGGHLLHPNIGLGAWVGLSHWSSSPDEAAPSLTEVVYFAGGEVPIKLGSRALSLVVAPRLGFAVGTLDLDGRVPSQTTLAVGVDLGVTSLKYHVTGSLGFLRAAVPPTGELGQDHDFGGLYALLGGAFDG